MDLVLLIIFLRSGYIGSLHGIWVELLRLVSVAGAIVIGANTTFVLAERLATWISVDVVIIETVVFFTLTLVAWLLLRMASRWIGRGFQQHAIAAWNQMVGVVFGLVSGALVAGLVAWALVSIPWDYLQHSVNERSLTGAIAVRLIRTVVQRAATLTGGVPSASHFFSGA